MIRGIPRVLSAFCLLVLAATTVTAEWPYLTEEAANLSRWRYSLSLGVGRMDWRRENRLDEGALLTVPEGVYWGLPVVQGTVGVGTEAEVSFDYEYLMRQPHDGGSEQWESGDLRLWTKLGLLRSECQALSMRFGVKLPNSNKLGTNEMDFFASALYDLELAGWVASANAGIGVLGNPAHNRSQDDVVTWGLALRWLGSGEGPRAGAEATGKEGPFGVNRQRDARLYAGVLGWQWGHWRLDGTLRYGVYDWKGWGWLAGVTYDR